MRQFIARCLRLFVLVCGASAPLNAADVNVQPGYYLVDVYSTGFNRWTSINNHGQIVWEHADDGAMRGDYDIMMYDKQTGQVTKLTDDSHFDIYDGLPDINDAGTVVWCRAIGPGPVEIVRLHEGVLEYITNERNSSAPRDNSTPDINDMDTIAWIRRSSPQCSSADHEIWRYSPDAGVTQISSMGLSNQSVRINNLGTIVWTRYNFCDAPWTSQIWQYRDSEAFVVSPTTDFSPTGPVLDDVGTIGWSYRTTPDGPRGVGIVRDGVRTHLSAPSLNLLLSDMGHLTYAQWYPETETYQLWVMYRGAAPFQLTGDEVWNFNGEINDIGEIAWVAGISPDFRIRAMLRRATGDLNCDGVVTVADVSPFVLSLIDPKEYQVQQPSCDVILADCNGDRVVTLADISCFVQLLAGAAN